VNDTSTQPDRRWSPRSIALIVLAWLILHIGGLFAPGLLDDVDSVYIEIAREMLHRHDFVTPYIDGIRFFDKPPLMYWLAACSMNLFGEHAWAARLPLALLTLALLLATYAFGLRLFAALTPAHPDRGAFYATLALATSIGPYLYTRFFIPDILICLWLTLAIHAFLIALDRATQHNPNTVILSEVRHRRTESKDPEASNPATTAGLLPSANVAPAHPAASALLPCLAFAAVTALNLLTKGLIGIVFPIAFVLLYLALTRNLRLLAKLHPIASTAVFLAIAAPWHILAALRNPPIAMPPGLGLPAHAGWAWFYLYNEHIARFLSRRIPHDYGQTPVWLFWLFTLIWIMPWGAFLPAAIATLRRNLGHHFGVTIREREAALTLALWTLLVVGFFTLSARQEYYALPCLPALALLIGSALARAEATTETTNELVSSEARPHSSPGHAILLCQRYLLLPLASLIAVICAYFAVEAPHPAPGSDLSTLLATNPDLYNLSLGHLFDLTGAALGLFRGPLAAVALGMAVIGPASYVLRRQARSYAANLAIAAGMTLTLLAAHEALVRFNPILGSKGLADTIVAAQASHPEPNDLILIDGELTAGSTLLFYTRQPVHLVNGRENGPWFGSFWPDAPAIFETDATLHTLWSSPRRLFLLTYNPAARSRDLARFGPVYPLASAGGKTILTNHP
jgi:4-amino-4-deoxy-L-arabinose transferase-like glycosyltransferase